MDSTSWRRVTPGNETRDLEATSLSKEREMRASSRKRLKLFKTKRYNLAAAAGTLQKFAIDRQKM